MKVVIDNDDNVVNEPILCDPYQNGEYIEVTSLEECLSEPNINTSIKNVLVEDNILKVYILNPSNIKDVIALYPLNAVPSNINDASVKEFVNFSSEGEFIIDLNLSGLNGDYELFYFFNENVDDKLILDNPYIINVSNNEPEPEQNQNQYQSQY